jgi:hypothetical protein
MKARPPEDRFKEKFNQIEGGCWEWIGYKKDDGYGVFWTKKGTVKAHRWAYEYFTGPIPEGMEVHHTCNNRSCVNPLHLKAVTRRENVKHQRNANREKTHCPAGHPYSGDNLYVAPSGRRDCRACKRARRKKK